MRIDLLRATFSEGGLFDGSGPSTSLDDLDALDALWDELRYQVVGVQDECLEHPGRSNSAGEVL